MRKFRNNLKKILEISSTIRKKFEFKKKNNWAKFKKLQKL